MKVFAIGVCLLAFSGLALAQDIDPLGSKQISTYTISELPNELVAADVITTRDSLTALMLMSYGGGTIVAPGEPKPALDREFLYQLTNVVWTTPAQLSGTGDFLLGYKIDVPTLQRAPIVDVAKIRFRLTYTRRQAIVSITPRSDFSPSVLKDMAKEPTAPVGSVVDRTITVSNLKQVCLAAIMLGADYDDITPYVQSSPQIFKFMLPYTKNADLFKTKNPMGGVFLFNMSLAGVSVTDIERPAETPMIFESEAWPDGKRCVGYADGHVKVVTSEEWQKIQPLLKLKLKRHGKPIPPDATVPPVIHPN